MDIAGRRLEVLTTDECLALLRTVPVGRIVFTDRALPAIRPVNFILDEADQEPAIVIRTAADSTLATDRSVVVAFEVDEYEAEAHTGWYVTVTGRAQHVNDPAEAARLEQLPLRPWAPGRRDHFIRIMPEMLSGRRITADADSATAASGPMPGRADPPDVNSAGPARYRTR